MAAKLQWVAAHAGTTSILTCGHTVDTVLPVGAEQFCEPCMLGFEAQLDQELAAVQEQRSAILAVRAGPQESIWHLVDGRPLDAALCGAPRPRRGWWDLGPREWATAANTCGACLAAHDREIV